MTSLSLFFLVLIVTLDFFFDLRRFNRFFSRTKYHLQQYRCDNCCNYYYDNNRSEKFTSEQSKHNSICLPDIPLYGMQINSILNMHSISKICYASCSQYLHLYFPSSVRSNICLHFGSAFVIHRGFLHFTTSIMVFGSLGLYFLITFPFCISITVIFGSK